MTKLFCIYHGHCDDGFAAAWAVRQALGDGVEFYAGQYQALPPDVAGRDVLMVDFSYKRDVIEKMRETAHSIAILDHHKTAQEDLEAFGKLDEGDGIDGWLRFVAGVIHPISSYRAPVVALFDMNRSGAGLAWDFFHPGQDRPAFINYVEDRDLWRKALPNGDEFTIALRSYPQAFDVWDAIFVNGRRPGAIIDLGTERLIEEGKTIQRYYRLRVEELKRSAYIATLADTPCWVSNAPYFAASEVAGELAERGLSFGVCYFEIAQGRWAYSLRSRDDFDVSAIARKFGGGGHKNASGFTVDSPAHVAKPT